MNRMVVKSTIGNDGILHLDLPLGVQLANTEVQVTVETVVQPTMTADDLLQSGLVGIWAGRSEVNDSLEFARHLRDQAQTRMVDR